MNLRRNLRLTLTFYRNLLVPSWMISAVCAGLYWEFGSSIFIPQVLLKFSTMTVLFFFIRSHYHREFYYYQNLGLSRVRLWTTTLLFDLLLYLLLLFAVAGHMRDREQKQLRYEAYSGSRRH